jgi:microcystin degradation protein MlrC
MGMAKFRVGVVGLLQETMGSSPFLSDRAAMTVLRGEEMMGAGLFLLRGALARLKDEPDVEIVPLIYAKSWPGGAVERSFYDWFLGECIRLIKSEGPFDALLVGNHSAMEVDDLGEHGDTHFIRSLRAAVGPDLPIVSPLDMHGQMTPDLINSITAFSVLRTAPHRDDVETGARAAELLLDILKGRLKSPVRAYVSLPIHACGEITMTTFAPMQEIFGALPDYDKRPGIVAADIFIGFGWNDSPWIAMQAVVTTDGDPQLAADTAREIAQRLWDARAGFVVRMETATDIDEGLERAQGAPESPVYVSDSGDNTSAGAGGDLTFVLQRAIANPKVTDVVILGIYAPGIVAQATAAGEGAAIEVELGAEHVSRDKRRMHARGKVVRVSDKFDIGLSGMAQRGGAWVSIQFDGVLATFHVDRIGIGAPAHLEAMDIHPTSHKVYVFKLGYLMPDLEDTAARHICLVTEGNSDLDFNRLAFKHIARPAYPMDKDATVDLIANTVIATR